MFRALLLVALLASISLQQQQNYGTTYSPSSSYGYNTPYYSPSSSSSASNYDGLSSTPCSTCNGYNNGNVGTRAMFDAGNPNSPYYYQQKPSTQFFDPILATNAGFPQNSAFQREQQLSTTAAPFPSNSPSSMTYTQFVYSSSSSMYPNSGSSSTMSPYTSTSGPNANYMPSTTSSPYQYDDSVSVSPYSNNGIYGNSFNPSSSSSTSCCSQYSSTCCYQTAQGYGSSSQLFYNPSMNSNSNTYSRAYGK